MQQTTNACSRRQYRDSRTYTETGMCAGCVFALTSLDGQRIDSVIVLPAPTHCMQEEDEEAKISSS